MAVNPTHPYVTTPGGIFYREPLRADSEAEIAARPDAWTPLGPLAAVSTTSGMRISPTRAMCLPAYYGCIRNIAEDVAKLPLITYRRLQTRGKRRAPNHPLFKLLHDAPNPDMTAMTFREVMQSYVLGWGNAYAEIERDRRGTPIALWPIHPRRIAPQDVRRVNGHIVYDVRIEHVDERDRRVADSFDIVRIRSENMLHIQGLGDGYSGMSIAQIAAENLGLNLAAQTLASAFFGNGMNPGAVLEHPGNLGERALQNLRSSLEERHQGARKAGALMILEEGMKYQRQAIPPNEAQFLESRMFGIEDIARWFRMPLHKIQHLTKATFNNMEQLATEYLTDALMAWLVRWEQEIKRKLFTDDDRHFAEHEIKGVLRGDMKTRGDYMWRRFQMGSLSPDDIRELENENPTGTAAGKKYYIQVNMTTLDKAASGENPTQEPFDQMTRAITVNGTHGVHHATTEEEPW